MTDAEFLAIGQVFEKYGMCKQLVCVNRHGDEPLDGSIEWCRPGSSETHAMWLPLWVKWAKTATRKP